MVEIENDRKKWNKPEILSLEFKNTKGGFDDGSPEDDDYIDLNPSDPL